MITPFEEYLGDLALFVSFFCRAPAKECVNAAYELPQREGLRLERRCFHGTFALADQKEGMAAFAEKRAPNFTHK